MLSAEQQTAVATILQDDTELLKVSAVAGSGKTYTLVQLANQFRGNCLYLAYNKAISVEAATKFGPNVECKTTHSLAYRPIVTNGMGMPGVKYGPRKVDWFNYRNIEENVTYDTKIRAIEMMEKYFLSRFISLTEFIAYNHIPENTSELMIKYVKGMADKSIPCTHAFYLKYYHILLAREVVKVPKYDLIMLDEAGDINEVTLEIFKALPARKKVLVGDIAQNIYSFNGTINGFTALRDIGKLCHLTKSFRCSAFIAKDIEKFGKKYIDPTMHFTGVEYEDETINSTMYIARTNGSLIAKMIELNKSHTEYTLTRPAKEIFGLLLTIISLKPGCKIYNQQYKYLLDDMKYYHKNTQLHKRYKSLLSYIAAEHHRDKSIKTAIKTIIKYGGNEIFKAYNIAQSHEKGSHKVILSSGHSAKGLEADKVVVDEDFYPDFILDPGQMTEVEIQTELNLVYVVASRARKELIGMSWLDSI